MDLIKIAEQAFAGEKREYPEFKAGDTVTVTYKIKEVTKRDFRNSVALLFKEEALAQLRLSLSEKYQTV